jgi:sigma-B regulation protein RsbU (phosphoserine phosphatase)
METLQADKDGILDELARSYEEIHVLQNLAGVLDEEIDHRLIFQKTIQCLREVLPVEKASVWVPDPEAVELRCLLLLDGETVSRSMESVPLEQTGLAELARNGLRVLRSEDASPRPADADLARVVATLGYPAVICPLQAQSRVLGILLVKLSSDMATLDAGDLRLLAAVAHQTSVGLHLNTLINQVRANEGLRREIEIARQIQHDLLPQSIPATESLDLFAGCVTAAQVGGDYYDFFTRGISELGCLIADVAGHSVASALIAMSFRTSFRLILEEQTDLRRLFERLNTNLHGELRNSGNFLSAFASIYDETTRVLRYVNAGHPRPVIFETSTGQFRTLDDGGMLLGILPMQEYPIGETRLAPGDILVLYTDGIVEAENQHGEFFRIERLQESIRRNARKSAREIYHYILKDMYLFQDERFNKDDVTLIILKVRRAG